MKPPGAGAVNAVHLRALLLSWAVLATGVFATWVYARRLERTAISTGLVLPRSEITRGLALQRAVLHRSDAFLLFGSSEIVRESPFRAMEFFANAPTGFRIVGIGERGTPLVVSAFDLAALGSRLRSRRIAVSVSHNFFHANRDPRHELQTYLGTFSVLHASQIAFGSELAPDVQRRVAGRLLARPEALQREPLIRVALEWNTDGSPLGQAAFAALAPMGNAQRAVLAFQDHLRMVRVLPNAHAAGDRAVPSEPPDWQALSDSAERTYRQRANNNPFGMLNSWWSVYHDYLLGRQGSETDVTWKAGVAEAEAWADLRLLLDVVTSSGGDVLLLSMPYKGVFRDFEGTTRSGRRIYYDSLRAHATRAGVAVRDFAEFEEDRWFMRDQSAHPSPKGWVYYNEALDEFFGPVAR